jgi:hypothetical protein
VHVNISGAFFRTLDDAIRMVQTAHIHKGGARGNLGDGWENGQFDAIQVRK